MEALPSSFVIQTSAMCDYCQFHFEWATHANPPVGDITIRNSGHNEAFLFGLDETSVFESRPDQGKNLHR